ENAAILQHVADACPHAELAPRDPRERSLLHQWLGFIGTELHKGLFNPLLDKAAPEEAKTYALSKADSRLSHLSAHLEGRDTLLDRFSVADAYLVTVLNWSLATPVKLTRWPTIAAYAKGIRQRPAVSRAFSEETRLYLRDMALGVVA